MLILLLFRKLCTITCIANGSLTSMLKILSNPIINCTIGNGNLPKTSLYLQLCFRVSWFCYDFVTKAMQNPKVLADPSHKMWEKQNRKDQEQKQNYPINPS